ncbi:c6 transcription [Diplodia corticola]|uniref:C6 transcription n=1 Tax=Diplodia corticola TaxID=236234 RepID=A0A1J9RNG0_9PEZI|nr:c6 transcription [Diplodia corticola]OJD30031.1 c6 transcription [Diplodia corticola]
MSDGYGSSQMDDYLGSARQRRPTCEPCRQRKVRCNRKIPCAHCARLHLHCTYGKTSRRAPLSALPEHSPVSIPDTTSAGPGYDNNSEVLSRLNTVETLLNNLITSLGASKLPNLPAATNQVAHTPSPSPPDAASRGILVGAAEGGSYVDDSVFVDLLLDDHTRRKTSGSTSRESAHAMLPQSHSSQPVGVMATDVFGPRTETVHVAPHIYPTLWAIYVRNVDLVMKLLHIPTAQPLLLDAAKNTRSTGDTTVALLYAVSFAATASVTEEETMTQFGLSRLSLLRQLMYQMDQSLMKAKFLIYPNLQTLQSIVIYLTALRTHDTGRPVWVLVGMAIRLAESLGLHRDGSRLGLSPFETEMRCRLWWQLSALDSSAPEDYGLDSTIFDRRQPHRLPLNVDDADLSPEMTSLPASKESWTEMTFTITNFDICRTLREATAAVWLKDGQAKGKAIQDAEHSISSRWLRFSERDKPVCQAAEAMLHLSILKSRFNLALQSWLPSREAKSSATSRYQQLPQAIFATAVDVLEGGYMLQSGTLFPEFAWFFRRHPELYALFLVLHCLRDDPERPEADRAWKSVGEYCSCLKDFEETLGRKGRASCVWEILRSLRENAREACHQATRRPLASTLAGPSQESTAVSMGNGGSEVIQMPPVWPEMHEFLQQGSPAALDASTLDNFIAWHDFSDWLNLDSDASESGMGR